MSKSHIYKLKVFVEDVDFGRVFYSRYLQYIERARTELIQEKFGLTLTQLMNEHDIMFVVRSCNIRYLKSAVFEDNLSVATAVLKKTNVRLNLLQEVKKSGKVLVRVNPKFYRPAEVDILQGCSEKAKKILGWEPKISLEDLCKMMVDADLARN